MRTNEVMPLYLEYASVGGPSGIDAYNVFENEICRAEIEQQRRSEYYLYENDAYVRDCTDREEELFGPFDPWGDDRPY